MGPLSVTAFADGASRGNPGPASIGVVVIGPTGAVLHSISRRIGRATASEAEWRAVIAALEAAIGLRARAVTLVIDSPVVQAQLRARRPPRNPALRSLWSRYHQLVRWFDQVEVRRVPRAEIQEADRLARAALGRAT